MLTDNGVNNILKRLLEAGGMAENVEADIQRLRTDINERNGFLKNYGEIYEGDDLEEFEYKGMVIPSAEETVPLSEYQALKQKYIDRFFNGTDPKETDKKEDIKEDTNIETNTSYDDLFTKKGE